MTQAHDDPVLRLSSDLERGRHLRHHEGVIARCGKPLWQPFEQPFTVVKNFTDLAVHQGWGADNFATEHLTDGLMAEADSEDGRGLMEPADNVLGDPGFGGNSGARRNHDT